MGIVLSIHNIQEPLPGSTSRTGTAFVRPNNSGKRPHQQLVERLVVLCCLCCPRRVLGTAGSAAARQLQNVFSFIQEHQAVPRMLCSHHAYQSCGTVRRFLSEPAQHGGAQRSACRLVCKHMSGLCMHGNQHQLSSA